MPEIKRDAVWRGKGVQNRYRIRVVYPGRQGARVTCEWLAPAAIAGRQFRCLPEQLLAAYEPERKSPKEPT